MSEVVERKPFKWDEMTIVLGALRPHHHVTFYIHQYRSDEGSFKDLAELPVDVFGAVVEAVKDTRRAETKANEIRVYCVPNLSTDGDTYFVAAVEVDYDDRNERAVYGYYNLPQPLSQKVMRLAQARAREEVSLWEQLRREKLLSRFVLGLATIFLGIVALLLTPEGPDLLPRIISVMFAGGVLIFGLGLLLFGVALKFLRFARERRDILIGFNNLPYRPAQ